MTFGNVIRSVTAGLLAIPATTALAEPIQITMWSQDGNGATGQLVQEFNASQDEIEIVLGIRDFSSLVPDTVRAFATKTAPDIVEIDNPEVAIFSSRGLLYDLTDLAATAENFDVDAMFAGPRAASTWEGRLFGIPKAANTIALYYNADLFEAAGLDPDNPPATWSELEQAAAALNDPENGVSGLSFSAAANEEGTFQFLPWIQMAGAGWDNLNSEGAIAALEFWARLYQSGNVNPDAINTGQWDLTGVFNSGKTAMHISGPWELNRMSESAEFDWRVTLLPTMDGSDRRSSALGEFAHLVNAETEHPEAAFAFIDWFHKHDADMWNRFGLLPAFGGVDSNPENFAKAFGVFNEQMKYASVRGPHPEWPRISRAIQDALQSALVGEATAAEAMATAAAEVDDVLGN
ncbi:Sugar ABC transporter, periplasmic sugar-binding protein [Candidatus Rhodobacter oscarellae]|uniref:Sugar ABC transporter, periplasmic sugar-binding protein n=1 Tax=Candidatus Rhodobacter oscarellae TaxID=1675527 RepID=A0A0J9E5L7_9RHOB|nr:sugar ABC transporter substrate-binding protein [Candidatus Rhodobacter lobularis]KMW57104.1 Sugar ABC transporter, periplasmic sugar-binding protein [Candidatus Rhodobacter lobularis]